jgi:hypothetical protein
MFLYLASFSLQISELFLFYFEDYILFYFFFEKVINTFDQYKYYFHGLDLRTPLIFC